MANIRAQWKKDAIAAVEKGAAALDEDRPGWPLLVDIDNLKMQECHTCIIGHVYGLTEDIELDNLFKKEAIYRDIVSDVTKNNFSRQSEYGFTVPMSTPLGSTHHAWPFLRDVWIDAIKSRLDKGIDLDG